MKGFTDLWIDADGNELEKIIDIASMMGYKVLCVSRDFTRHRFVKQKNVFLVKKRVIAEAGEKNLKEKLRGVKVGYPVVAVIPLDVQAARLAARDGRVDIIVLNKDSLDNIDKTQALMMKQFMKILEVPLNDFLKYSNRVKSMIYRRIHMFYYYGIPIVYSSHAKSWNELIHPRSIVGLINSLLGVDKKLIVYSISSFIVEFLAKNGVRV